MTEIQATMLTWLERMSVSDRLETLGILTTLILRDVSETNRQLWSTKLLAQIATPATVH